MSFRSLNFFILSAQRTPIGTFMGKLKNVSSVDLAVHSSKAALAAGEVSANEITQSVFGNVCSVSNPDGAYLARHVGLKVGVPESVGGFIVNRLCGSGFEALAQAQAWVSAGPVLAGGSENMTLTPLLIRNAREGYKLGKPPLTVDSLWEALTDTYAQMPMGLTAEGLAQDYKISREECDEWAYQSHRRAAEAESKGLFKNEIFPVVLSEKETFSQDEHIRRDASLEKMRSLKPVFGGVITAANASGVNDAAASLVVASEEYTKQWMKRTSRKPLAKVIAVVDVGCNPKRMGIGPVEAIRELTQKLNWNLKEIPYVEINEAFAPQVLACKKALELSNEQLNPHGSGISLGHPLGATGARISTHIAHLIGSGVVPRAIGAACIGGGMGIAMAFERGEP